MTFSVGYYYFDLQDMSHVVIDPQRFIIRESLNIEKVDNKKQNLEYKITLDTSEEKLEKIIQGFQEYSAVYVFDFDEVEHPNYRIDSASDLTYLIESDIVHQVSLEKDMIYSFDLLNKVEKNIYKKIEYITEKIKSEKNLENAIRFEQKAKKSLLEIDSNRKKVIRQIVKDVKKIVKPTNNNYRREEFEIEEEYFPESYIDELEAEIEDTKEEEEEEENNNDIFHERNIFNNKDNPDDWKPNGHKDYEEQDDDEDDDWPDESYKLNE